MNRHFKIKLSFLLFELKLSYYLSELCTAAYALSWQRNINLSLINLSLAVHMQCT